MMYKINFFDNPILLKRSSAAINFISGNLIFHLFLLLIVAWHCLPLHGYRMFNGLDGIRHLILTKNEWEWWPISPYLNFNIFQGMANVFYGFNLNLMPIPLIQNLLRHGHVGITSSYLLYSVQYFIAVYLWARLFCFSKKFSITTAWILTVCALPFLPAAFITPEFQTVPEWIDLLFFSTLLLWCCRQLGRVNGLTTFLCLIGLLAIPYYLVVTSLYFILLVTPIIILSSCYFLIIVDTRAELITKISCYLLALMSVFLLQIFQFLYALVGYSAYNFFSSEMFNPHISFYDVSMLFKYAESHIQSWCVILSIFGAGIALKSEHGHFKKMAILHLILTTLIITLGLLFIYLIRHGWKGSEGGYYEILLWPSYVAFSLYAVYRTAAKIIQKLSTRLEEWLKVYKRTTYSKQLKFFNVGIHITLTPWANDEIFGLLMKMPKISDLNTLLLIIPLAVLLFNHAETSGISHITGGHYPGDPLYPPAETSIIALVRNTISLQQNSEFKGYAATFTPKIKETAGISWFDQAAFDYYVNTSFGNDHRLNGLWYYNIPTLNEYSHLITPPLYLIETRLLSRPIDKPIRTGVAFTVTNINVLSMLGVKFIITNDINNNAMLRKKLFIDKEHGYLYLYELANTNVGNYSPTQYISTHTARKIIALMQEKNFPFQNKVIVSDPLPSGLVPAKNAALHVSKRGVHLTATSDGISTLLLPVQYSHCLTPLFKFSHMHPQFFKLQRADLVNTLVTFSGVLDVTLTFSFGPWPHVKCRLLDIKDMQAMHISLRS